MAKEGEKVGYEARLAHANALESNETSALTKKHRDDSEVTERDEDFILFQEYGMPQQGGIGISIDRWTMLLTNRQRIRDVILFPLLKPEK